MICTENERIQLTTEESEITPEKTIEQSPASETDDQLFVPESLFRANLESYTCGVKWSPQGEKFAVATERRVHVFKDVLAGQTSSISIKHAECLYDWNWVRLVDRDHVVTTGRYQPVQLYSQQTHHLQLEGSYKCINHLDELTHAFSVATDHPATSLYCGLVGEVRVFDVSRPGRECWSHTTRGEGGQHGIISCLDTSQTIPIYAAGSFDRTVGLYTSEGERLCQLKGHEGGVTQVTFTRDGTKLLTGARKDSEILCWDLRQPGKVLYTMTRVVQTNQTVAFSLSPCNKFLVSANTDGSVRVWDLTGQVDQHSGELEPLAGWMLHRDAVTGVSWHPHGDSLATATGQRHFSTEQEDLDSIENVVVVWNMTNKKSNG